MPYYELQEHQKNVLNRIKEDPYLIVNHGLGTGKTLTSIAAAKALGMPADVVVPASLQSNYRKELEKHLKSDKGFNIISLQNLATKPELLQPSKDKILIVDEAHRLRNPATKPFRILQNAEYGGKILLSATPMYNTPQDVINLGRILKNQDEISQDEVKLQNYIKPGRIQDHEYEQELYHVLRPFWSRNKGLFIKKLREEGLPLNPPIQRPWELSKQLAQIHSNERDMQRRELAREYLDYSLGKVPIDRYEIPKDGKDFAKKIEETVEVPMSPEQEIEHNKILGNLPKEDLSALKEGRIDDISSSFWTNPFLVKSRIVANQGPKVDRVIQDIKKSPGQVLVYSNFLDGGIKTLSEKLQKEGIPFRTFTGEETKKTRDDAQREYNEGKIKALLVSSAGGEGLSLKNTREVAILEPHWNVEKLNQVEGRAIRFKSHEDLPEKDRNVRVRHYLSGIDSYLKQVADRKQEEISRAYSLLKPSKEGIQDFIRRTRFDPNWKRNDIERIRNVRRLAQRGGSSSVVAPALVKSIYTV